MTPFEQGYYRTMKLAFNLPGQEEDKPSGMYRAGMGALGAGTAGLVANDVHRMGQFRSTPAHLDGIQFMGVGMDKKTLADEGIGKRMARGFRNASGLGAPGKAVLGLGALGAGTALWQGFKGLQGE